MENGYNNQELALFRIDDDCFGIEINQIQEINRVVALTPVFNSSAYVKGVMNLRGQIVTVIDLRTKLRYGARPIDDANRILIARMGDESVGILVDQIEDIVEIDPQSIETGTARIEGVNSEFFNGIYKMENKLVVILNVDRVLQEDEPRAA